jgi:spermidine synthase
VTLVDLDPEITALFSGTRFLAALNGGALSSPKVHIVNADAFVWLQGAPRQYDAAVVDFPDPSNYSVGKLFTVTFFRRLAAVLTPGGRAVIQSTSPLVAPRAVWCVERTLQAAGLATAAYHALVPSFGEWGFVIAGHSLPGIPARLPDHLRFVSPAVLQEMFSFPPDMQRVPTEVNRLDNQVLVRYYEAEWGRYLAE